MPTPAASVRAASPRSPHARSNADLDDDGSRGPGEPFAVTDIGGAYELTLDSGTYTLRQSAVTGWMCTVPADCALSVTVVSRSALTDNDFASRTGRAPSAAPCSRTTTKDGRYAFAGARRRPSSHRRAAPSAARRHGRTDAAGHGRAAQRHDQPQRQTLRAPGRPRTACRHQLQGPLARDRAAAVTAVAAERGTRRLAAAGTYRTCRASIAHPLLETLKLRSVRG